MRTILSSAAALALVLGVWLVVPDLVARLGSSGHHVRLAARLGVVRDDLWAATAGSQREPGTSGHEAGSAAVRALRLAPLRAEAWLALASQNSDPAAQQPALTMSFFTGPGDRAIVDRRLELVARNPRFGQPELCSLLRPDVDFELKRGEVGRTALHNAFADAPPANRDCLTSLTPGSSLE